MAKQIVMGLPDDEGKSETGSKLLIYETKKYGISCVKENLKLIIMSMVIGFVSKWMFLNLKSGFLDIFLSKI